jgi:hypothetical protein
MNTVKLQGFEGDFHITKQEGVFVELLAMSWQSINGELFYLPNPHLGFKEWQEMGGSLSSTAKVKYTYGRLYCHKNQITNI